MSDPLPTPSSAAALAAFDAALAGFDAALAAAETPEAVWKALQALTRATIGARLFTVMEIDDVRGVAARAFTSDPVAYPATGTKPLRRDAWTDLVHGEKKTFVADTLAAIAQVFPDHATIGALGCGSVLNLPIEIAGKVVGTLNALDVEHHYDATRRAMAERLRLPAKAAWLAARHLAAEPSS